MRTFFFVAMLAVLPAAGAERVFNFGESPLDQTPPGFRSVLGGTGKPGEWKMILDDAAPQLEPITPNAPVLSKRAVLAQLGRDSKEYRFPMFILEGESFDDFKMTTRFKIVGGAFEQTAGLVFRYQNESNYYVIAASPLSGSFRCYKFVNGEVKPPIGPELPVSKNVWHDLTIQCDGNRILGSLDGQDLIKLVDPTSSSHLGKVGFWTKSDTLCYFSDAKVEFTRREILAKSLVRDALRSYPRVNGLKIFAVSTGEKAPSIVASKDETEIGRAGGEAEQDVIANAKMYYGRDRKTVSVTLPLRDRNGEPIAAVCVVLNSFPGQTQDNALARALPIVQRIQAQVHSLQDLLE